MKLAQLNVATLTGLFICTLNVHAEQGSNNVEQRVNNILAQMTLDEKLYLYRWHLPATTYGVFNTGGFPVWGCREIDMCNGPLGNYRVIIRTGIDSLSGRTGFGCHLESKARAATW